MSSERTVASTSVRTAPLDEIWEDVETLDSNHPCTTPGNAAVHVKNESSTNNHPSHLATADNSCLDLRDLRTSTSNTPSLMSSLSSNDSFERQRRSSNSSQTSVESADSGRVLYPTLVSHIVVYVQNIDLLHIGAQFTHILAGG